jgi:hypothetical protein
LGLGLLVGITGPAFAQVGVTLPDSAQTTILTADVAEQAQVTVPAGVTFTVNDITQSTAAPVASVTVTNIALDAADKQLKISLQANAAAFTPPVALATTWDAADVSWNAPVWVNATGATGTLSAAGYNAVATAAADAADCSTAALVFTLAANPDVKRSGNHTLTVTWKFESIGP